MAQKKAATKTATAKRSLVSRAGAAARKVVSRGKSAEAAAAPAKKSTAKAAAQKTAKKAPAAKQAPAKKAPGKPATTKKTTAKKAPAKPATTKKKATTTAATKAPAKKTATKKTATKKTTATKAPAKKAPAKKAPVRKSTATTKPASLVVLEAEEPWTKAELGEVRGQLDDDVKRLTAELAEAQGELTVLMRDAGEDAGSDQADIGSATFERDQEMTIVNNARDMLAQSERALERIAAGTYGVCESCGNPIGKNRLMAFPRATLCMTCKQREERR
ncbi:MAG TPA: TraR/DksA C4-type zinc finger protein [Marmoricola sp.]|jgi:DnaK suppressor protein|nr:TraR/DksA C4-type zinc finger protein [Marmoricola sp.]